MLLSQVMLCAVDAPATALFCTPNGKPSFTYGLSQTTALAFCERPAEDTAWSVCRPVVVNVYLSVPSGPVLPRRGLARVNAGACLRLAASVRDAQRRLRANEERSIDVQLARRLQHHPLCAPRRRYCAPDGV